MVQRIIDLLRPYLSAPWGYAIVGLATFLENSVGAGVVVPGETLVIIGGFYARVGDLWLPLVAFVAVLGAVIGDNVGYWIGRRFGRGFLERHGPKLFLSEERLARADRYYGSHGGKTVFLGRFIPVVRSVGFILAGVAGMEWRRFAVYDLAGAVIWGTANAVLGYLVGESYERWQRYVTPIGLGILVVLLVLIGGSKLRARRRRLQGGPEGSGPKLTTERSEDR